MTTVTRRYRFQAVHSLYIGIYRELKHGHDFYLEITVDLLNSSLRDLVADLDGFVNDSVLPDVHGRELNRFLEPATGENLTEWIHNRLLTCEKLRHQIKAVAIQETRKNRFISSQSEVRFV